MRGGRAGGGEASGGRRAGFHHHKFLPLHPASAASTPRWNAKGSRTWNRRGTPWFDSPARLHVVETVHEYTLTTVNGKRQKRFVEKNFHDRARIGSRVALDASEFVNRRANSVSFRRSRGAKRHAIRRDTRAMRARVRKTVHESVVIAWNQETFVPSSHAGRSATLSSTAVGRGVKRAASSGRNFPVRTRMPRIPSATLADTSNSSSSPTMAISARLTRASFMTESKSSAEGFPSVSAPRPEA